MDLFSYLLGKNKGGGGGTVNLQEKEVTITENTTTTITPDENYDGLSSVEIITSINTGAYHVENVSQMEAITTMKDGDICLVDTILPNTYTPVEYIVSSGTQYIDTGVNPAQLNRIDVTVQYTQVSNYAFLGSRLNDGSTLINKFIFLGRLDYNNSFQFSYSNNPWHYINNTFYLDKKTNVDFHFESGLQKIYINKELKETYNETGDLSNLSTVNLYLFGLNSNNTNEGCPCKIYLCKFYNNDSLNRHFIPCYRNSDNVIGMYDLVNNVFYTNNGTGNFSIGEEVQNYIYQYDTNNGWVLVNYTLNNVI